MFDTPILYLVFNRPNETALTFAKIREIKPSRLFIASDGPRLNNQLDIEKCRMVQEIISEGLNWNCDVRYLIRENNLGCGRAVSQAIDWFFHQVEYGIILEDDCLPSNTFFPFCAELLKKYKDTDQVTHISGHNTQMGYKRGNYDYYFSRIVNIWGWATWSRAWKNYQFNYENVELLEKHPMRQNFPILDLKDFVSGAIDTWDTQWLFTNFINNNFSISPNINLVHNVGFNQNATHTDFNPPGYFLKNANGEIDFPLKHPKRIKFNDLADQHAAAYVYKVRKASTGLKLLNRFNKQFKVHK